MKSKKIISMALVVAMFAGTLAMTGCTNKYVKESNSKKSLAVTIGKEKIYMDKMVPFIYLQEFVTDVNNEQMKQMYAQYGMDPSQYDSWTTENDGKTGAETLRDSIMESYIRLYILNKEAIANKSESANIPEDKEKKLKENADNLIKAMSDKSKDKTGLTAERFLELEKMLYTVNKYSTEIRDGFNITAKDVEADIDYDNVYRQYNSNYVRMSTSKIGDDDTTTDMTDEEKATVKSVMDKVLADLKSGKSVDQVCADYEGVEAATSTYTYTQEEAFPLNVPKKDTKEETKKEDSEAETEKEEPTDTTDAYMLATRNLNNGDISDIFEYNNYYYIAIMEDNNSKEAYDSAIDNAITTKISDMFEDNYSKLQEKEEYKSEINKEVWESLELGDLTIIHDEIAKAFGTLED